MSQLEELFTKYGTDKGTCGYTPAYETHIKRAFTFKVLEIGICGFRDIPNNVIGASLFAWRDYLPHAEIYGIDNDARFIFNDQDRIHTALCDAYDPIQLAKPLMAWRTKFDFICDDAVHDPIYQVALAHMLWPSLNIGGVYAIEEACPYKCPTGRLDYMMTILDHLLPHSVITEYQTHKPERLLVLQKQA